MDNYIQLNVPNTITVCIMVFGMTALARFVTQSVAKSRGATA